MITSRVIDTLAVVIPALAAAFAGFYGFKAARGAEADRDKEVELLAAAGDPWNVLENIDRSTMAVDDRRTTDVNQEESAAPTSTRSEFQWLWQGAQERLSTYHQLAVIQGRQSFRMLLLFSSLGFVLLGLIVWKATEVDTTPGGIALGTAGAAGTALTGYIGRTFMRAYRDANERLIDYFAEPLDMSRLLAAERLLSNASPGERDRLLVTIIDAAIRDR